MSWQEYKEQMRDEWEFYKRNPSFPIIMILWLGTVLWALLQK
jgi:hypothetical protein